MRARAREIVPRAVAFVVVVGLVALGASALSPADTAPDDPADPVDVPEYDSAELVSQELEGSTEVPEIDGGDNGTVLIDVSHTNGVSRSDFQALAELITSAGYRVTYLESSLRLREKLSKADAYVVADPRQTFSRAEVDNVEWFVESGGRLLLMGEPLQAELGQGIFGAQIVAVESEIDSVASRFGVDFGETHLYNTGRNDGNYLNVVADGADGSAVGAEIGDVSLSTATHVTADGGHAVLHATNGTESAGVGEATPFTVAHRTGNVLAVGDTSLMIGGNANVGDNEAFLGRVTEFLLSGSRSRTLIDYPGLLGSDPTIRYTDTRLLESAQQIGGDLRKGGEDTRIVLNRSEIDPGATDVLVTTFDDLETMSDLETGVSVDEENVSVDGITASRSETGIAHAPAGSELDLVIAADTESSAELVAQRIARGDTFDSLVSDRTLVVQA